LVIPKAHGVKLADIPDDQLAEILVIMTCPIIYDLLTDSSMKPVVKKLVLATGAENYNVLQNNGRIAHQEVDHVSSVPPPLCDLL
jgi:diadenosine tetraphosphate (Ap4A) HIT family hydrolase